MTDEPQEGVEGPVGDVVDDMPEQVDPPDHVELAEAVLADWKYRGNPPRPITEEDNVHLEWYDRADKITAEELHDFVEELRMAYDHDYGTIVHACTAAALAAAHCVDRSPAGGITGFQAGAVMWEFVSRWLHIEGPARILAYRNLLLPKNEGMFRRIRKDTWEWVQEEAARKLATADDSGIHIYEDVKAHLESIVAGTIPFGMTLEEEEEDNA